MQAEKSQPEGLQKMPETRLTEFPALSDGARVGISRSALISFPALSVYPRAGISRSASETSN